MSLAQEILAGTYDRAIAVSDLLRKFKVLLSSLGDEEKLKWADTELKGYKGEENLPEYRKFQAVNLGHFHGPAGSGLKNANVPLFVLSEQHREQFATIRIYEGMESIEAMINSGDNNFRKPWPAEIVVLYQESFYEYLVAGAIWQPVGKSELRHVVSVVRDQIADYMINLQKERPEVFQRESALEKPDSSSLATRLIRPKAVKPERQLKVFLSYSHADETYKVELDKHLAVLRRGGYVSTWNDRMIPAGAEWESEIDDNIKGADIILLLISADFINSEYCYGREMDVALGRHDNAEAIVIPIIVRHALLDGTPFMALQAFPKDAKPVSSFSDKDEAYAQIARAIQGVAINFEATLNQRRARA